MLNLKASYLQFGLISGGNVVSRKVMVEIFTGFAGCGGNRTMFGFSVITGQTGSGSPRSLGSLGSVSSPTSIGTPRSLSSPKQDVGEIDTRAPFQSVKAAVSLFGDAGASPKTTPVSKKTQTLEERVLEKETQHHLTLKELEYYREQLRSAEIAKAQALSDLKWANRTLQELTNKLENLSESKQAAFEATEAAKKRAEELEEQKSIKAQLGDDAWRLDVDSERELYKATASELISTKQELTNLRQDFDAALEAKLTAFQEAAAAQHAAKVNQERLSQLSKEVTSLHETIGQVKLASIQAQEQHSKLIAEKEARLLNHKIAKEEVDGKVMCLKAENDPKLSENLEEKLEETTEAIKVLQEQLNDVKASDLTSLRTIASDLDDAKRAPQEVVAEENSLQRSVESIKLELENVKREHSESEKKAVETESAAESMQADLAKSKTEMEAAISGGTKSDDTHLALEKLLTEAENTRLEVEVLKKKAEALEQEAEEARIATKEAEEKLQIALKEAEKAKAAERLADDQIHSSPKPDSSGGSGRRIKLSLEEFESLKKKIEEIGHEADVKVATAMAQVETINASEKELLEKVETTLKENEDLQSEIEDALKRAEMAEAAKKVVEGELQKWHQKEQSEVGET
ncbi:WEB family protein At5g55860-like [Olea europaea var. sylvestris]|uniref:WEB family protein At5g55860-like n=1 Tax=Olea europaea var. sylvestris TaxID=158386 RepID=UPI000C1D5519|nr:WEB family protein At5g55860-like [Olea europaea var. sylvestris]